MHGSPSQAAPEPCRPAVIVLDFDGTLTDADAHAPAFHEASGRELARRLGWDDATRRPATCSRSCALAATTCGS